MSEEKRIPIYGKDAEDQARRAFDIVMKDGQPCIETKDRYGHKVWTAAREAFEACKRLRQTTPA